MTVIKRSNEPLEPYLHSANVAEAWGGRVAGRAPRWLTGLQARVSRYFGTGYYLHIYLSI